MEPNKPVEATVPTTVVVEPKSALPLISWIVIVLMLIALGAGLMLRGRKHALVPPPVKSAPTTSPYSVTPAPPVTPTRDEHGDMAGKLETFPLPLLIEFFFNGKDSGKLSINDENGNSGHIILNSGHVIDADYKGRFGLAAAEAMLRLPPKGTFEFNAENFTNRARVIEENTMVLLLRIARGE